MTNNYWLEARNISCIKNGYEVVKNLNLKLKYGENVIVIGPNGSGKSSLLELINRTIYPVIKKDTVFKIFNRENINIWELRKKISVVNYDVRKRINPKLKVFDLISSGLYGTYHGIGNYSERDNSLVENLINKMSIKNLSQKYFSDLSEGEKKIALIARSLVNKPDFLILDEPIANLDLKSKFYVIDRIKEITQLNSKIVCITHDISMITEIYNRVIMLKDRMIIADGNQQKTMNSKNINYLYDININLRKDKDSWHIYRKPK